MNKEVTVLTYEFMSKLIHSCDSCYPHCSQCRVQSDKNCRLQEV